jgi:WD40 repeat protein
MNDIRLVACLTWLAVASAAVVAADWAGTDREQLCDLNERARLRGHTNDVCSLAITPDGKTLVSGSRDRTIRLWDLTTGKERVTLKGNVAAITCVVVVDARTLASASTDGTIKLWNLTTGEPRAALRGQPGALPADASNQLSRQACCATQETAHECTTWLAPSPGLLRHAARHRAFCRP